MTLPRQMAAWGKNPPAQEHCACKVLKKNKSQHRRKNVPMHELKEGMKLYTLQWVAFADSKSFPIVIMNISQNALRACNATEMFRDKAL